MKKSRSGVINPGSQLAFEDILATFANGASPLKPAIIIAVTGIAGFAFLNIKLLTLNLARPPNCRKTESCAQLVTSNGDPQLMAMPLAMTVNAGFILKLVFCSSPLG